jgi:hypothetical protein
MFNSADNSDAMTVVKLQHVLGDLSHDGIINGAEQPEHVGEYILLSGGPDGIYGPASTTVPITSKNPCDDVTNYGR